MKKELAELQGELEQAHKQVEIISSWNNNLWLDKCNAFIMEQWYVHTTNAHPLHTLLKMWLYIHKTWTFVNVDVHNLWM